MSWWPGCTIDSWSRSGSWSRTTHATTHGETSVLQILSSPSSWKSTSELMIVKICQWLNLTANATGLKIRHRSQNSIGNMTMALFSCHTPVCIPRDFISWLKKPGRTHLRITVDKADAARTQTIDESAIFRRPHSFLRSEVEHRLANQGERVGVL